MKIPMSSILFFAAALAAADHAVAETYQHGGSTATIHQHSGNGRSEAQVEYYRDGQNIITRDDNSTDITIQREEAYSAPHSLPDNGWEYVEDEDDFKHRFSERMLYRFSDDFFQR